MDAEKNNNMESKEIDLADKEGKKLDSTNTNDLVDVVNKKNIKAPTTTPGEEELPVPTPTEPDPEIPTPTEPDPTEPTTTPGEEEVPIAPTTTPGEEEVPVPTPTEPDPMKPTTTPGEEEVPVPTPTEPDPIIGNLSNNKENNEYTNENYEKDRNIVFDVIRRNGGFKDNDEYYYNVTGTKEKGDNFVKENYMMLSNPNQLKKRVVVQNNLVVKNNFINHREDPIINVDKFMERFIEEQEKLRTKYTEKKIINAPIEIKPTFQEGVVGEFVELSQSDKTFIAEKLNKVVELKQEIHDITIIGKADSTSPRSRDVLSKQANDSISRLEKNGFKKGLLNNVELIGGEKIDINELLKQTDNKDRLNQLWALNRALMQIDFLDRGQVALLNNSLKFKIIVDAQKVDGPNKGNQFTGGGIDIDTKGNERIEKEEIKLALKELNSPILFFHININNTKNGIIDLVYRNNKLELEKSRDNKTSVGLDYLDTIGDSNIANYSPAKYDFGNLTLNLNLSNEDIGLIDTKEVTDEMPIGHQRLNQYENIKSYNEKSNNYFDSIKDHPEDFIKLLNVYKEKTNKLDEKKYIEGVIETIKGLNS